MHDKVFRRTPSGEAMVGTSAAVNGEAHLNGEAAAHKEEAAPNGHAHHADDGMDLDADTEEHPRGPLGAHSDLIPEGSTFVRTKIVCTLGPASREVPVLERLLRAGMNVARFNFSHGSHEYHQGTLNNLRQACANTKILCAVLLDTKARPSPAPLPSPASHSTGIRPRLASAVLATCPDETRSHPWPFGCHFRHFRQLSYLSCPDSCTNAAEHACRSERELRRASHCLVHPGSGAWTPGPAVAL